MQRPTVTTELLVRYPDGAVRPSKVTAADAARCLAIASEHANRAGAALVLDGVPLPPESEEERARNRAQVALFHRRMPPVRVGGDDAAAVLVLGRGAHQLGWFWLVVFAVVVLVLLAGGSREDV